MRWLSVIAAILLLTPAAWAASGPWDQPAAELAGRIADILGAGQARLTVRNLSSIPNDAVPTIRRMLEQDLKERGIAISGADSASAVSVTLSENARNRLWVAEIAEGDETQVAMVSLPPDQPQPATAPGGLLLRSELVISEPEPVLAALEVANSLVVLEPDAIAIDVRTAQGWQEQARVSLEGRVPMARDPRGILLPSADSSGFEAWLPGAHCTGSAPEAGASAEWSVECNPSDDPWTFVGTLAGPLAPASPVQSPPQAGPASAPANAPVALKAFYNAARDYFTGVLSPGVGVDLPAFYAAVLIPRGAGNGALLVEGIDGKVRIAGNGSLAAVAGARDWGSDLAELRSGCGTGTQVLASGSGEAASDSLRAYELPALEAVPVSAPLAMQGKVTALWSAPDFKSVYAAVRTAANQYEVVRVSALCN
jgi:hypothetical protein